MIDSENICCIEREREIYRTINSIFFSVGKRKHQKREKKRMRLTAAVASLSYLSLESRALSLSPSLPAPENNNRRSNKDDNTLREAQNHSRKEINDSHIPTCLTILTFDKKKTYQ